MKLSIIIISLVERATSLARLLDQLRKQLRVIECEIVVVVDSGQERIGAKRNRAVEATIGEYVIHIDDDDEVSDHYLDRILTAINGNPGVDAVIVPGVCTSPGHQSCWFDYRLDGIEGQWINRTIWRSPGHVCAIRRELARAVRFPEIQRGEDLQWSAKLAELLKTAVRASDEALYFYRLDPSKAPSVVAMPKVQMAAASTHEAVFTPQYVDRSGPGSEVAYSQPYRRWLGTFIFEHSIKSIIDLGCGDAVVMRNTLRAANTPAYLGIDVIPERIRRNREEALPWFNFECADLRTASLDAELIVCKDVLQHWSTPDIEGFLDRLLANHDKFRFALITNCNYGETVNTDIVTGGWRALDLTKPPFESLLGEIVFQWGDDRAGHKDVVLIKGRG